MRSLGVIVLGCLFAVSIIACGSDDPVESDPIPIWHVDLIATSALTGVWAGDARAVFVAGHDGYAARYDGSGWILTPTSTQVDFNSVSGVAVDEVYAVGVAGVVRRFNGVEWLIDAGNFNADVEAIWGGGSSAYAVGFLGQISEVQQDVWLSMTSNTTQTLYGVHGTDDDDVFAVGANGTIMHYDGSSWSAMTSNVTVHLRDVFAFTPTDVLAVGDNGTLVHYDGTQWQQRESGTQTNLTSVWAAATDAVFVGGEGGLVLRYDGAEWRADGYQYHVERHGRFGHFRHQRLRGDRRRPRTPLRVTVTNQGAIHVCIHHC